MRFATMHCAWSTNQPTTSAASRVTISAGLCISAQIKTSTTTRDARHRKPRRVPNCRVLPPSEFNGTMLEPLFVATKSFMMIAVSLISFAVMITNIGTNKVDRKQRDLNISPDIYFRTVPLENFPLFLHGVGNSPFRHQHPPIYNVKRSTVSACQIRAH